jgi:hypothetical protein
MAFVAQALRIVPGIRATQGFWLDVIHFHGCRHVTLASAVSTEGFGIKAALAEFAPVVVITWRHAHYGTSSNGLRDSKARCSLGHASTY